METFEINTSGNKEPIAVNYFPNKNSRKLVVVVGGSGDNKDAFNALADLLIDKGVNQRILTFSFRGYEQSKFISLYQEVVDLKELLEYLISVKKFKEIVLVCTSAGAYSTSYALADKKLVNCITKAIFVDPADYLIENENARGEPHTWSGAEKFDKEQKTSSDLLKNIKSDVVVDVVHFTLRNYGKKGYAKNRGEDNPKLFPRLNTEVVKKFYESTPDKNKGKYIEVNNIPHAIKRDGNPRKNMQNLSKLLSTLIN